MPRLLIDGRSLTDKPKGVGRYAYQLCEHLNKLLPENWEIHIAVCEDSLPIFSSDLRAEFIKIPKTSELKAGCVSIPALIKKLKSDVLLKPNEGTGVNYSIPIITVCHDINQWIVEAQESQGQTRSLPRKVIDMIKNFLIGKALRSSEYVICNSEFIKKAVTDYFKVDASKTRVAYCGVDQRFYQMSRYSDKHKVLQKYKVKKYILTFATGDNRENFMQLPKIIKQCRQIDLHIPFIIAGVKKEHDYAKKLKLQFKKLQLEEGKDFIFEGFLGDDRFDDLVDLYTNADFYLELSLHEGFGMQLAEAMACGTTCISSTKGALAEVSDKFAVLINNPTNVPLIANKIKYAYERLLHQRDNTDQIEYTRKFSWENTGRTTVDCLLDTAERLRLK